MGIVPRLLDGWGGRGSCSLTWSTPTLSWFQGAQPLFSSQGKGWSTLSQDRTTPPSSVTTSHRTSPTPSVCGHRGRVRGEGLLPP